MSDLATPWTAAYQAPLSMGFSWQEYWSGLPLSCLEDLPDPEIKLALLASFPTAGGFFTRAPWEALDSDAVFCAQSYLTVALHIPLSMGIQVRAPQIILMHSKLLSI